MPRGSFTLIRMLTLFVSLFLALGVPVESSAALDSLDHDLYECLSATFFLPEKINDFVNANASPETTITGSMHYYAIRLETSMDGVPGTMTFGPDNFTFQKTGKREVVVTGKNGPRQTLEEILDNRSETAANYVSNELSREKRDRMKADVRKALESCNTQTIKETKNTGKLNEILGW